MDNNNNQKLAQVFHYDLYGKRAEKYDFLLNNNLQTVQWRELELIEPQYFFVAKDFSLKEEYEKGFSIQELFPVNGTGVVSKRDELAFQNTKDEIIEKVKDIYNLSCEAIKNKYNRISWESRDGKVEFCKNNVMKYGLNKKYFVRCNYRPFDTKWTYYTGEAKGFLGWPVQKIMQHFLKGKNVGLVFRRQQPESRDLYIFCSNGIIADGYIRSDNKGGESLAPLYLYLEGDIVDGIRMPYKKTPNLNESIINEISQRISLQFTEEKGEAENTFAPIDVLDYIYAILHSPAYRERYKEFLKIDFPRVPYPENTEQFWKLALLGGKLRRLHLLEGVEPQQGMADYPIAGSNEVTKPEYVDSKVYINDSQFFENIPLVAWNFYIGGYQPAQKWLKDRKGRTLNYDDIEHYRKIIWVLKETEEVMKKIDKK